MQFPNLFNRSAPKPPALAAPQLNLAQPLQLPGLQKTQQQKLMEAGLIGEGNARLVPPVLRVRLEAPPHMVPEVEMLDGLVRVRMLNAEGGSSHDVMVHVENASTGLPFRDPVCAPVSFLDPLFVCAYAGGKHEHTVSAVAQCQVPICSCEARVPELQIDVAAAAGETGFEDTDDQDDEVVFGSAVLDYELVCEPEAVKAAEQNEMFLEMTWTLSGPLVVEKITQLEEEVDQLTSDEEKEEAE